MNSHVQIFSLLKKDFHELRALIPFCFLRIRFSSRIGEFANIVGEFLDVETLTRLVSSQYAVSEDNPIDLVRSSRDLEGLPGLKNAYKKQ